MKKANLKQHKAKDKHAVHQSYYDKAGTYLPGASTIAKIAEDPGGLIWWAWDCGMKRIEYNRIRETAATIGTVAHYMAECHLREVEPDLDQYSPNDVKTARISFGAFLKYLADNKVKPILIEHQMVSEKYKYGGTPDLYANVGVGKKKRKTLIDLKTSKGFYPNMVLQAVAYEHLLVENGYPVDDVILLRMSKQDGSLHLLPLTDDRKDEWTMFKKLLALYPVRKKIHYKYKR